MWGRGPGERDQARAREHQREPCFGPQATWVLCSFWRLRRFLGHDLAHTNCTRPLGVAVPHPLVLLQPHSAAGDPWKGPLLLSFKGAGRQGESSAETWARAWFSLGV